MHLSCTNFVLLNIYVGAENTLFLVIFGTNLHYIWLKFSIIINKIGAESTPSNGVIWDEFSEQYQHQSPTKNYIQ